MESVNTEKRKCYICEHESEQLTIYNLDILNDPVVSGFKKTPPELIYDIQECPNCGYISKKLEDVSYVTQEWLKSDYYNTCDGRIFKSDLAEKFYKSYLIDMEDGNYEDAFYAAIYASWICEDRDDEDNKLHCQECNKEALRNILMMGI